MLVSFTHHASNPAISRLLPYHLLVAPAAVALLLLSSCTVVAQQPQTHHHHRRRRTRRRHTSNHAVIVSSSRYWFNYRHVMNALSIYKLCKDHGIPDSNIVLMLADELPSDPRNPLRNGMYTTTSSITTATNYYNDSLYNASSIEIDYRGDDVTVENLVRVLLGRHHDDDVFNNNNKNRQVLHSNADSHVLVYWTGHGGDEFFKFQDVEEITARDLQRIVKQMHERGRYKELLFLADTCQAYTLSHHLKNENSDVPPNVYAVGSSLKGENSYAHHSNAQLGLSVIERYTYALVEFVKRRGGMKGLTLQQALVDHLDYREQRAHVGYSDENCERRMKDVPLSDFFANVVVATEKKQDETKLWEMDKLLEPLVVSNKEMWYTDTRNKTRERTTRRPTRSEKDAPRNQGSLDPSDPRFLGLCMLFFGFVVLASQIV